MNIHYFMIEVAPSPSSDNFHEFGGAIVNCWINAKSKVEAEAIARKNIKSDGWCVVEVSEYCLPGRDRYLNIPGSLERYDTAEEYGEAYITHTWPPEPQEEDIIN